jgi:hypothetical protein
MGNIHSLVNGDLGGLNTFGILYLYVQIAILQVFMTKKRTADSKFSEFKGGQSQISNSLIISIQVLAFQVTSTNTRPKVIQSGMAWKFLAVSLVLNS